MEQWEIKEREGAALLCEKMTDEELDKFYENPGIAKYVRAFAEGKVVFTKLCKSWHQARTKNCFEGPQVSENPWRIFTVEATNNIED